MTRPARDLACPSPLDDALRRCRGGAVMLLAFSAALNVVAFAGPLFSLQVFDRVLNARSEETLVLLLALTLFLLALQAALESVRSRVLVRLGLRFDEAAAPGIFDRLVGAGLVAPRNRAMAGAVRDLDCVRDGLAGPPALALLDAPFIPLYLAACFLFHPLIGWTVVACGAALGVLAWCNDRATNGPLSRAHAAAIEAGERAADAHARAELVQALGMLAPVRALWSTSRDAMLGWQALASDRTGAVAAASRLVRLVLPVAATALGGWLVIRGEITPGVLIASSMLAARALLPIDGVVGSWRALQGARAAWARLRDLERTVSSAPVRTVLPRPSGRIDVARLVLVPPGSTRPALRGVSFDLMPGEALGVVGSSGSGKSALARALTGTFPPLAGEIRLDGARLDQFDPGRLGADLGYLPQDPALMPGTVAQNIARFRPDATAEAVTAAARAAGAHDLILALAQGYDTIVGEGGSGLSGGQRQRVALARALFGDPSVIVLDEPNAALDGAGEEALMQALAALRARGATVVLMTHRTGVLGAVDKLLVLDQGQARAFGPRDQVVAAMNADAGGQRARPAVVQGGRG